MAITLEQTYLNGLDRGRALCLTKGHHAALQWLREHRGEPEAYRQGVRQAIRDFLDADGLPRQDPLESA